MKEETINLARKTWDPRTRLILVMCLSSLALICNQINYLLPILIITSIITYFESKGNSVIGRKRFKSLLFLCIMIAIIQSLFHPSGQTIIEVHSFPFITTGGINQGVLFLLRMLIIIISAIIVAIEDRRYVIQGLIQFKLPYELAFMTVTAIHFIPMFQEEIRNSLTAIQLRGLDLKKISIRKRIKVYTYILIPVSAGMMIKAKEMALAMEMRCFRAKEKRSSYIILKFSVMDYSAITIMLTLTITTIIFYFI